MFDDVPSSQLSQVGHNGKRDDSLEKLTGEATYVSDMTFPGLLHAQLKKSPHARARIVAIDTSRAAALPGVRAIVTGDELDYRLGLYVVDKRILARDEVRHYGEAVVAVAADTIEQARAAVEAIDVQYEVLKPVLHHMDALQPDAPLVHPDLGSYSYMAAAFTPQPGTNIANHTKLRKGDVEKAFAEAEWVVEREYSCPSVQHVPLETHVAIVEWGKGDKVSIWSSAQSPFTVRNLFCHAFGLSHNQVRVQIPYVGGGFGGKAGIGIEPLCAVLSRQAGGRAVKFQASREEEFSLLPCRSALTYRIKTGVDAAGKIVGQHMTMYWDSGAYADYAVNVTRASGFSASGPYEIPNAWLDAYTIYTNKPYGTAYRGFGHVEFHWAVERHMELVAEAIGMDPFLFRLRNALRPGSLTMTGEEITAHSGNVLKCLETAAGAIHYGDLTNEEKARQAATGWKIGKGVAALQKAPAMPPFTATSVILKMNEDGSVLVNLALTDYGQGTYTSIRQIVAERLGFPLHKIKVAFESDTDRDPYDWQTVASKGLLLSGNAAILAAEDLLHKAYAVAAEALHANPCDLGHDGDKVFLKHHPKKSVNFSSMAVGLALPNGNGIGGPLIGVGRYIAQGLTNLNKDNGEGFPAIDWTFGAHGIIVEVNEETGEYHVLKIASVYDVGRAIHPDIVRGQAIGGMLQGLGTAICEGYIYDQQGRLLNPSFTDNKIPTAKDLPLEIECYVVETPQVDGPYGARGVGEHSMISVAPALGNAIQKATGAELMHMPMRSEDVWRALNHKEPIDNWITKSPIGSCRSAPEARPGGGR
ncbi:MAG: xanthine dehydrogenase [Spirochaetes bacterium GWD1_61_31]|nr:MAG: xanthine dehydrogenase [Spirochaetes bacterium GWB1_60_80]OHD35163.1 MAG: xanthine dehydrogenase [Spirochaetes bacterium GWC1_61_12]OHD43082.1 MAG: xanthine dehydrogenase [Spirochaetes bacterium GWE1_60_18]OHD43520.1 MAG: xanthine dehydrogenase [Spirochaetes bacterium GWD1_61_31]OHD59677.1 MAG: xanthine dehydrogenase [Spirochaetes bacterium GWF1_60_12]HAP44093.1 xanthine dehydrogenase [Spirochaetaceae bacterium]